ncbi:hypothetical protein CV_1209 [Chromobacterium violaceum ATCC 12472]|uniref:Uncharacterized protein n=1 Tax=Chromobacterium violaceum (strain ATCC 12472 / DSM 30191 / JCM 1249 / CCUG 213 / NBRC 12614 / NCIMB 9131 / NCTC 9757 / MK) TaxID=243365 RepID=Q7NYR4_CHRVO|nr:hypothetical protein CV_1209 [Chromobacterium violaceum ATCC 12472]
MRRLAAEELVSYWHFVFIWYTIRPVGQKKRAAQGGPKFRDEHLGEQASPGLYALAVARSLQYLSKCTRPVGYPSGWQTRMGSWPPLLTHRRRPRCQCSGFLLTAYVFAAGIC